MTTGERGNGMVRRVPGRDAVPPAGAAATGGVEVLTAEAGKAVASGAAEAPIPGGEKAAASEGGKAKHRAGEKAGSAGEG